MKARGQVVARRVNVSLPYTMLTSSRSTGGKTTTRWLKLSATAIVTDYNVQLAIRPKAHHASVMVAAQRLSRIGLKGMQPNNVAIKDQRRAVPVVSVDAVTQ